MLVIYFALLYGNAPISEIHNFLMFCVYIFLFVAPSAPPKSLNVSTMTSSSVTVQWEPVDCIHRNGDIIGYSVQYGEQGGQSKQTVNVSGGATYEGTIFGLHASTMYTIEVAAVNSVGVGVYSNDTIVNTLGEV